MGARIWRLFVGVLLGCVYAEAALAGRSPEDRTLAVPGVDVVSNSFGEQSDRAFWLSTTGPRSSSVEQAARDQQLHGQIDAQAFGDYYYQDEASTHQNSALRSAIQSDQGTGDHDTLVSHDAEEQRQAYLLEDQAGRLSVIEQQTRDLPNGGRVMWQRTTGPDRVTVTTVATNHHSQGTGIRTGSIPDATDQFSSSSGFLSGTLNSALTPLNKILDALDAQQQQLSGMMMSRYMHAAAAATQQQPQQGLQHMVHRRPCPRHQAMTAAAAAAAQPQQQQQQEYMEQDQQQFADFAERFATQQDDELVRLSREQQLQDILEANGLALAESGAVISLEEAQRLEAAMAAPDQPELDDFYMEYIEPAQVEKDFADTAYDVEDDDYMTSPSADWDYELDAASMGDYSFQLAAFLNRLGQSFSDVEVSSWFDVDVLLVVVLVACTIGMCVLFLQSLLQLCTVLAANSNLDVATLPLKAAGPYPVAVAAGYQAQSSSSSSRTSADDLSLPLLIVDDAESPVEQQQQQRAFERFYNPLHYQALPGKM